MRVPQAELAKIDTAGTWSRLIRGPLPGAGSWSHEYGNAANTSSNEDQRIKGGLSVLWYGDPGPGKMVNRHNGAVGPLSVNGRLFIQGDESIMAYDSYNGTQLWEVPNPGAMRSGVYNAREPGNMAASDDALFMLLDEKCVQFDAAKEEVTLLREGKPVLTTKVMVKEGSQKSPYSSAHFTTTPKGQMLTTLTFEGDKRILHLHDGQLSTADGQELDQ